jgi:hypothetical protein
MAPSGGIEREGRSAGQRSAPHPTGGEPDKGQDLPACHQRLPTDKKETAHSRTAVCRLVITYSNNDNWPRGPLISSAISSVWSLVRLVRSR